MGILNNKLKDEQKQFKKEETIYPYLVGVIVLGSISIIVFALWHYFKG